MKKLEIKKPIRVTILVISLLMFFVISFWTLTWFILVILDYPPGEMPSTYESLVLNKLIIFWILSILTNILLIVFTKSKSTKTN